MGACQSVDAEVPGRILGEGSWGIVTASPYTKNIAVKYPRYPNGNAIQEELQMINGVLRNCSSDDLKIIKETTVLLVNEATNDRAQTSISFQMCTGRTLESIITEIDTTFIVKLLKTVLSLFTFMHKKGIFHNDLHEGNIMLCTEGKESVFKVIDFGNSCTESDFKKDMTDLRNMIQRVTRVTSQNNIDDSLLVFVETLPSKTAIEALEELNKLAIRTGGSKAKKLVLGRNRRITKVGRLSMIMYKGTQITLTEARAIERKLASKKNSQKIKR